MMGARQDRLRIALDWVFLAAGVVVLVLSGLGRFRAMVLFPWIFGPVLAVFAGVDLLRRRRAATALEKRLLAGVLVAGLLAPVAQTVHLGIQRGRSERAALATLAGRPAPALASDFSFNAGEDAGPEPRPGRLTVVNFWATWCPPCLEEMPMLAAWARDHDPSQVRVIGYTRLYGAGQDEEAVRRELEQIGGFLLKRDVGYLNLVERGRDTHDAYAADSMPSTVLIGRGGEVLDFGIGRPGTERILATAEGLLGG